MNNQELLKKYRKLFLTAQAITTAVTGVVEIFAYVLFIRAGRCELSFTDPYFLKRVALPIGLNCLILFAVALAMQFSRISDHRKNEIVVHGCSLFAMVIAVVHREFVVTAGAFMFPMILSAVFNNNPLIIKTFILSLVSTSVAFLLSWMENAVDLTNMMNYLVMYGFVAISFLACYISNRYAQLNSQVIEDQAADNKSLREKVLRDPMTGLYNHGTFYTKLNEAIEKYMAENKGFSLALIDIDYFKRINDTYGHESGDDVLIALSDIIRSSIGEEDDGFRYGGEEFAILFSDKSLPQGVEILEKMLKTFSETVFDFTTDKLTFSGGIAQYSETFDRETFFNGVDTLLYDAKHQGRNRISTHSD